MSATAATTADPTALLRGPLRTLTVGALALVSLGAFEAMAVATAMPTIAAALDGLPAYALAFGLPLATSVLGMVVAGTWSDARGPAGAMRVGVGLFVVALLMAGLSPSMPVFAIARALQGLGSGLFSVALYVVVGHVVPAALRPRIFAGFAAAWVLPAVVGPPIAGGTCSPVARWRPAGVCRPWSPCAGSSPPRSSPPRRSCRCCSPASAGSPRPRPGWSSPWPR